MSRPRNTRPPGTPPPGRPITGQQDELFRWIHQFRVPTRVLIKIALFWTTSARDESLDINVIPNYMKRLVALGSRVLGEHGLTLDVMPVPNPTAPPTMALTQLPYNSTVDVPSGDVNTVRTQADQAMSTPSRLPVIICPVRNSLHTDARGVFGVTMGVEPGKTGPDWVAGGNWLPFVLINSRSLDTDSLTMLHEIGHAARLGHEESRGTEMNFMNTSSGQKAQVEMLCCQVIKLASAYFAEPAWAPPRDVAARCPRTDGCRAFDQAPASPSP